MNLRIVMCAAGFYVDATTPKYAAKYRMYTYITEVRSTPVKRSTNGCAHAVLRDR